MNTTTIITPPARTARDFGLLIIRVGVGACLIGHGWPKIAAGTPMWNMLGRSLENFGIHANPTAFGLVAAIAEFGGGILLVLGLLTRLVSFALVVQMVVAITSHVKFVAPDPTMQATMRAFNTGYSHALELGFVFLGLLFTGAGAFSADRALFTRRVVAGNISGVDVVTRDSAL